MLLEAGIIPPMEYSPLYVAFYTIFHAVFQSIETIYITHRIIIYLLVTLLSHVFLSRFHPSFLSFLLTAFSLLSFVKLNNHFVVHTFVLIPILLTYIATSHKRSVFGTFTILGAVFLTAMTRPDFMVAFPIALVLLLLQDLVSGDLRKQRQAGRLTYATLLLGCIALSGYLLIQSSNDKSRAWVAFGQHYAWGYGERNPEWTGVNWTEWDELINKEFEGATSVSQALHSNPNEFLTHISWNLGLLTTFLMDVIYPYSDLLWLITLLAFMMCLTIFSLKMMRNHRVNKPALLLKQHAAFYLVVLAMITPTFISSALIRPRPDYLLALHPLIFLLAGQLFKSVIPYLRHDGKPTHIVISTVLLFVLFPTPWLIAVSGK